MKYMARIAAAALAVTLAGPVIAQDVQDAADASMVLDNVAKGIANNSRLTTAIPGATMPVPIKSTGYFGGGTGGAPYGDLEVPQNIGTLGIGSGRRCPLVNAYRAQDTYMPGTPFTVQDCGVQPSAYWVGVRVYGMICSANSPTNCQTLDRSLNDPEQYENGGYIALLKPGLECSSQKWPTEELRRAGAPAYAEWCDYGVKAR